ncbi:cupredoxin domain-containing protein [Pseudomonas citronellolis]|uniref:copper-resistant cuproprotein CopI n=1 Tax=Pseudomonas citronellolis TaxID=53408 RepID=UPI0023E45865|nr:cupredoxin family protein [Pseudomonas citronellolis]MDF3933173.1 cupredoxin family protein [Pseudomonas citronellolis]
MRIRQVLSAAVLGLAASLALPALADASHTYAFGKPAKAAQATRTVEITLGEMYFEPKSLQVTAGETVRFVIHNNGSLLHEFNLGDAAMHAEHQKQMQHMQEMGMLTPTGMMQHDMGSMPGMDHATMMKHDDPNSVLVEPGKSAELTWTFGKATTLEFACNIPGHYQAGMVGRLTVEP